MSDLHKEIRAKVKTIEDAVYFLEVEACSADADCAEAQEEVERLRGVEIVAEAMLKQFDPLPQSLRELIAQHWPTKVTP